MASSLAMDKRPFKLINNYIYVSHLNDGEGEFLVLPSYPDTLADTMQSNFSSVNPLSRSAPIYAYSYSGPRQVNISLTLHRDMMQEVNWEASNIRKDKIKSLGDDYVDYLITRLQAVAVPRYDGSAMVQPPTVAVRFGNELFIKGIVNGNVGVSYAKPLIKYENDTNDCGKYSQVTLTFNVYETDPYDSQTIARDGSFRGITKMFKQGIFSE